ncbi:MULTISPECIES: hypothetical protein [Tsukamurella]|uniref:Secreted protein n=2 Tax=Tsukamurella TaxID=2060 RepID=A0A5C5RYE2_9ACTN|nr:MULTISPECIES: hypothetical protein [Tsukamurella]NMD56550.1 hypothetical protein [Tsukamurella columbiensis]TWS27518.1 hypothetical protein FK530_18550 [Tsukamurella conjunctivitidis]
MVRKRSTATIASIAALVLLTAGCSDDSEPASNSSSAPSSSATATHHQGPAAGQPAKPTTGNGGNAGPTKTVTQHPGTTRTVTKPVPTQAPDNGGTYNVPCTGPDQGTICTNPNHGAGDNPGENGTAPTTTAPKVRDDDPGGKPCTTGMGESGTYIYSDDTNSWVCQIG